ncbi:MAG: hypothetical protein KGI80_04190 [Verrucomicrobiota bacterium]|nr:hypothetical protein [Verrucomicrobiota bacterium]
MRFLSSLFLLSLFSLHAAKVGLLVVATGKYTQFVAPLVESARKYFCKGHTVTYFIFTDGQVPSAFDIVSLPHRKLGWPYDTLMRYAAYQSAQHLLIQQDYLFACDADMLFCADVGEEIFSKRVATLHPGFFPESPYPRSRGAYDTNPISTAYVPPHEGTHYFAGGFYGGESSEVLRIVNVILERIEKDKQNGYIAVWHDESHWNRYCIDFPPTLILSPSYCYPESWSLSYTKKLLALDKNHAEIR